MSVDDSGLEAIRKSAEQDPPGQAAEYILKTRNVLSAGWINEAIGRKIQVAYPSLTTETYTYFQGATQLYVLTVTYTDSTKANLDKVERTA